MNNIEILQKTKKDKSLLGIIDAKFIQNIYGQTNDSDIVGKYFPYISIHDTYEKNTENIGYIIKFDDIISFTLQSNDFLPTITLKFLDSSNTINSLLPIYDSSILNLAIQSNESELLKPIHINMDILDIKATGRNENGSNIYLLKGKMRIPKINETFIKSYKNITSYELLYDLSDEYGLGFNTNETETDDMMTWINGSTTVTEFIKHLTLHSYKDSKSFFTSFVDVYYNLNFINIGNCYKFDKVFDSKLYNSDSYIKNNDQQSYPLLFTNKVEFDGTDRYITNYNLISNHSKFIDKHAYNKQLQFFNVIENKFVSDETLIINPLSFHLQSNFGGVNKEILKDNIKYKYAGKLNENTHVMYTLAENWNYSNLEDLTRNVFIIDIKGLDLQVYRFQTVPVIIFEYASNINSAISEIKKEPLNSVSINETLSGKYIILNIEWIYSYPNRFFQRLYLIKQDFKKII